MITKQTSRRASEILAAQKKEYRQNFEKASGNRKAISKAAADYRSEYGRTPKSRWAKALSQAAKETATHEKPKRKTAVTKPDPKPTVRKQRKTVLKPQVSIFRPGEYLSCKKGWKVVRLSKKDDTKGNILWVGTQWYPVYPEKKPASFSMYHFQATEADLSKGLLGGEYERVSGKTALSMIKKKREEVQRTNTARENELKRQAEKLKAQDFKKILKLSDENVKRVSKEAELSEDIVKKLYNLSAKDELRPALCGIYFDPKGYAVSTDAYTLIAIKCAVPASLKGKVISPSGKVIEANYPNWSAVIPAVKKGMDIDSKKLLKQIKPIMEVMKKKVVDGGGSKNLYPCVTTGKAWVSWSRFEKALQIISLAGSKAAIFNEEGNKPMIISNDKIKILIMPIIKPIDPSFQGTKYLPYHAWTLDLSTMKHSNEASY